MSGVDDTYTKNLLHFDGTDASTTFTDESGKTWTAYGDAQIDTAQSKFGGASGVFDGINDYIETPDHDDFYLAKDNFTIDFWFKKAVDNVEMVFCGQCSSSGFTYDVNNASIVIGIYSNNRIFVMLSTGGTTSTGGAYILVYTTSTSITGTAWRHLAFVRFNGAFSIYIDGVQDGTTNLWPSDLLNNSSKKFSIGRPGEQNSFYFNGWIDEFRFTKGFARWQSNFAPPTSAYDYVTPSTVFIPKISIF